MATAYQFRILNTIVKKGTNHLITYYSSGGNKTQIDYMMARKENARETQNCKVLYHEKQ